MARMLETMADAGVRIAAALAAGEDPWIPVRDFVDGYRRAQGALRDWLLAPEPGPTGDLRLDAYLAGLAEHFAREDGRDPPGWVEDPSRFLDRSWFREPRPHFWPLALVQSPLPFRRRLVFIEESEFERV